MDQEKKIAVRVILWDEVKQTFVACHPTGRKWKGKDGKAATGCWSIPGGEIDEGEDKYKTAVREIEEECNIKLDKSKLEYLGFYQYIEYKDLEVFIYPYEDAQLSKFKCESMFEAPNGKMLPEVNGFMNLVWPEQKNLLFKSLQNVLEKVWKDHPDIFES
jgi:8-oxo-dGTP pyrophosphatase MutT (NUDIX family)